MHDLGGERPYIERSDKCKHFFLLFLRYFIYTHGRGQKAIKLTLKRKMDIAFFSHVAQHQPGGPYFHFIKITFGKMWKVHAEYFL